MARFTQSSTGGGGGVELPQNLSTNASPTFDKIYVTHNSDGTNIKVGDDAWIGDVDEGNQFAVIGVENSAAGGIIFGDALANKIYTNGNGLRLEANNGDMNFYMDGAAYIGDSTDGHRIVLQQDLNNVAQRLKSASYFSSVAQTGTANSIQAMTLNNTDWEDGVVLESNSHIKITNAGKYNIAFSAQLQQLNSSGTIDIWLRKNGTNVANSNTRMTVPSNNPYRVAAWNFFVDASANDYYEIIWSSDSDHTVIQVAAATGSGATEHPAVPSLILTVNQVG